MKDEERVSVDRVSGDPGVYQRPQRENDKCGKCGSELVYSDDGKLVCPKCNFGPWIIRGATVRF